MSRPIVVTIISDVSRVGGSLLRGEDLAVNATEGGMAVSPAAADYAGAPGVAERGVARVAKATSGPTTGRST